MNDYSTDGLSRSELGLAQDFEGKCIEAARTKYYRVNFRAKKFKTENPKLTNESSVVHKNLENLLPNSTLKKVRGVNDFILHSNRSEALNFTYQC